MHIHGVDRVMIATRDIEGTRGRFEELLGIGFSDLMQPTTDTEHGAQQVENIISPTGIELVAPRGEDNEVTRFIERNGPGLYAVSVRVDDLDAATAELAENGVHPVGEYEHDDFREAFLHPSEFGGAMVILAEYDAPHGAVTASRGN